MVTTPCFCDSRSSSKRRNMVLLTTEKTSMKKKKFLVISFFLGVFFLVVEVVLMSTDLMLFITQMKMRVYNGSEVEDFFRKPLKVVYVSTYLFNITNAEEFMSGEHAKLKVDEVGPFTYLETRYYEQLQLDDDAGEIRFTPRVEVQFVPEMAVADPKLVNVTMPNLPMLGITSMVSSYTMWTRMAFKMLANQLSSKPIVTMDAYNYMWGYSEPLVTLAHSVIPGFINIDKIGFLERVYDNKTVNSLVVGATGREKFMLKSRNGYNKLPMGNSINPEKCEICDNFTNSFEGVMYPSPMTKESPVRVFRNGLCRVLDMVYDKTIVLDNGVEGLVYNLSDSFYTLDKNVTKNRVLDLSACFFGLPLTLTKVHFLDLDPEMYDRIDGIHPDPTKNCYLVIEPKIALEVETHFPVQINLQLKDLTFYQKASPFSNMLLPIGWLDINQVPLPQETLDILTMIYHIGPAMLITVEVIIGVIAMILMLYPIYAYHRKNHDKAVTFPISSKVKQNILSVQEPLMNSRLNES